MEDEIKEYLATATEFVKIVHGDHEVTLASSTFNTEQLLKQYHKLLEKFNGKKKQKPEYT